MNLRSQVIALQRQIHELETLVETYQSESGSRLTRYRQVYLDAVWDDVIEKNRKGKGVIEMAFNINRFTEKSQEAVIRAQQLAEELNNSQVEPEHLLAALIEQEGGVVPLVLERLGADPRACPAGAGRAEPLTQGDRRRNAGEHLAAPAQGAGAGATRSNSYGMNM